MYLLRPLLIVSSLMLVGCSSTIPKALGDSCELKLHVSTDFTPDHKVLDKDVFFKELMTKGLNTQLPKNMVLLISSKDTADFTIEIVKAYETRRGTSISGNVIIEFTEMKSGQIENLRGVSVENTYWGNKFKEEVFSAAISDVVTLMQPKFVYFCKSFS